MYQYCKKKETYFNSRNVQIVSPKMFVFIPEINNILHMFSVE